MTNLILGYIIGAATVIAVYTRELWLPYVRAIVARLRKDA